MSQRPQRVLRLIEEAKEMQSKSLYLANKGLTQIPPLVFELAWLEELDLRGNKLTSLPESIRQLQHLRILDLSYNKLTSLPESIRQLQHLKGLYLSGNEFTSLPESIRQLQHLTLLDLSFNKLTSLPESITQLQHLKELYLRGNEFTSLPESITQLQHLTRLYLGGNKFTSLPDSVYELRSLQELGLENLGFAEGRGNQIKQISPKILQLTNLRELKLERNPIEVPPPEVVRKGLRAIKDYFRQVEAEGVDEIYEAKLLIVGEAAAGKTSLAKKLEDPAYELQPAEPTTEGIDVIKWQFAMANDKYFRVNVWDFGGQEIYHATHQFFLSRRSLYALVCDTRKEETDFYYWLNVVELLSHNSPLLIIKNEKQERQRDIPEGQLRGQFSNLKGALATNLATNRGLKEIKTEFEHYLRHLPHVGDKLPKTWVKVRHVLEQMGKNHISLDQYLALCRQHGFKQDKDALQLSGYLHDLGVILHFQEQQASLLYKTIILKAEWGTDAVYRVLDNKKVIANFGQFSEAELLEIWHEPHYAHMVGELLELMLKFKLCYRVESSQLYIAPQLLSQEEAQYEWDATNNLILRYHCPDFMPKGIISRFIVAMHHLIEKQEEGQEMAWRSGVILVKDKTRAEVIEYFGRREVKIRLSGLQKRDLMTLVTAQLDKLFGSFKRLKYDKLIPCHCPTCKGSQTPHFYAYETLRLFVSHGRYETPCDKPPFHSVYVQSLIDDVSDKKERWPSRPHATAPLPPLREIRQRLKHNLDDVQLEELCMDHFEVVYDQFSEGMRHDKKVHLLVKHCRGYDERLEHLSRLIRG